MNWLFTLLFLTVPLTAYANIDHEFEKFLYGNLKYEFQQDARNYLKKNLYKEINNQFYKIDTSWIEYIPTIMQIYLNSFALQQYDTNNYTFVVEKLSWREVKIEVRYYF
jgi:hypothetical protein